MARRKTAVLPPGAVPFDRTVEQWRDLGAPGWVFDPVAAAEAYVLWALPCYGGGHDPTEVGIRRYYVRWWLARCVKPQWLWQAGALLPAEVQLLTGDKWARFGRPGRCRSRGLVSDADVPPWLACCRQEDRRGSP